MQEQTEWVLVDEPGSRRAHRAQVMQALWGRWWKWKLAGLLAVAGVVALLAAAAAGILAITMSLAAFAAIALGRLKLLLQDVRSTEPTTEVTTNFERRRYAPMNRSCSNGV